VKSGANTKFILVQENVNVLFMFGVRLMKITEIMRKVNCWQ